MILVDLLPPQRALPDRPNDLLRRVRRPPRPRIVAQLPQRVLAQEPSRHDVRHALRIAVGDVRPELPLDDVIDVSLLLAGEERREHDGEGEGGGLGDGSGSRLGDEYVGRDHVLGHLGYEAEAHHADRVGGFDEAVAGMDLDGGPVVFGSGATLRGQGQRNGGSVPDMFVIVVVAIVVQGMHQRAQIVQIIPLGAALGDNLHVVVPAALLIIMQRAWRSRP
mmetsp:Transcript_15208/g.36497  ORF Transcript_15208/g.36497 Transcript_15208/m.36497 type:complete len:221 (-) Transcript_15208:91-753(-)